MNSAHIQLRRWLANRWPWVSKTTMHREIGLAQAHERQRVDAGIRTERAKMDTLLPQLIKFSTTRDCNTEQVSIRIAIDARLFMSSRRYDREYLAQLLGRFVEENTERLVVLPVRGERGRIQ